MIKMRKNVEAGRTPEKITVSMIDQDLKDGISKPEMAIKYGIKPWEVDEMFKHPFLKGRRPSRKKALSFSFVDDITEDRIKETGTVIDKDIPGFEGTKEQLEEIDPNQMTLEDAIQDTIDETENLVNKAKETNDSIVDLLGPHTQTPEETIKEAAEWTAKNEDGEKIELDQEDQDTLNDAFNTFVNEDGKTLKETFDEELEDEDDDTFEL
tara:strand:- start:1403 stop:2032 length:630 start_codon:yes stop_codon:yes gene_type:complete